MISGLVHHFKRKTKNEKDIVNDIRVSASFQKKEKKGKDIVGDIEYT